MCRNKNNKTKITKINQNKPRGPGLSVFCGNNLTEKIAQAF